MLASIVAILVVAILTVLSGSRRRDRIGTVLESARGNCLERREAIVYEVGRCRQIKDGRRRRRHHRAEGYQLTVFGSGLKINRQGAFETRHFRVPAEPAKVPYGINDDSTASKRSQLMSIDAKNPASRL